MTPSSGKIFSIVVIAWAAKLTPFFSSGLVISGDNESNPKFGFWGEIIYWFGDNFNFDVALNSEGMFVIIGELIYSWGYLPSLYLLGFISSSEGSNLLLNPDVVSFIVVARAASPVAFLVNY